MADEIQKVSWDTSRSNAELGAPRELVLNQNLTEGPELITQDNAGLDTFHFPSEEKLILSDSSELIGFNDTGLTYISGSTIKDAIDSIDDSLINVLGSPFYIDRIEIESLFKVAQSTKYTEYTYSSGNLTSVDIWDTSSKVTKLFTKTLTYTGADLTGITIVDEVNSNTLTKTLVYSGGNLSNKTETFT